MKPAIAIHVTIRMAASRRYERQKGRNDDGDCTDDGSPRHVGPAVAAGGRSRFRDLVARRQAARAAWYEEAVMFRRPRHLVHGSNSSLAAVHPNASVARKTA